MKDSLAKRNQRKEKRTIQAEWKGNTFKITDSPK